MTREKRISGQSLRAVLAKLTAGNLAYLGAQFLSFIALAQWAPVAEVGRFSWALALTSPIFLLADMRTRQVQLSTTSTQIHYRSFLAQRAVVQTAVLPVVFILGVSFSPDDATTRIVLGLAVLKTFEGFMNVSIGEHMRHEQAGTVAKIQLVRGISYGATFCLTIFLTSKASIAVLSTAIVLLIPVFVAHFTVAREKRKMRASKEQVIDLTKQAWPLGIGFFIGAVTINGPRLLVEAFHGVESLAVFTAVSYVIVLANTVVDSVTQGIIPRFAGHWRRGQGGYALGVTKRIGLIVACLGMMGLLVAGLAGDKVLVLLFGEPYGSGQLALVALFCAATLQYVASAFRATLIAGGMRKGVLWTSILNLTITLAIASLWVPSGGPESAGWALAIGQGTQLFTYFMLAKRQVRGVPPLSKG